MHVIVSIKFCCCKKQQRFKPCCTCNNNHNQFHSCCILNTNPRPKPLQFNFNQKIIQFDYFHSHAICHIFLINYVFTSLGEYPKTENHLKLKSPIRLLALKKFSTAWVALLKSLVFHVFLFFRLVKLSFRFFGMTAHV